MLLSGADAVFGVRGGGGGECRAKQDPSAKQEPIQGGSGGSIFERNCNHINIILQIEESEYLKLNYVNGSNKLLDIVMIKLLYINV